MIIFDGPARLRSFYLWYQKYIQSLKLMNFLMGRGINGGWITGGNAFIRAEALHKTRGYDTSFEFWGEDTVTAKRLAKVGHVIYSKDLVMKSSARRFVAPGSNVLKVIWKYLDNRF
jgi:GT2 family glycosyltransferase